MRQLKNAVIQSLYVLGAPAVLRRMPAPAQSMIVLAYHSVTDDPAYALPGIRVTPRLFAEQISHLSRHYDIVDLGEALQLRREGRPLPARAVAITFDDGYLDNFTEAFPVLRAHGAPATVFATVDPVLDGARFWVGWLYEVLRRGVDPKAISDIFEVAPPAPAVEAAFNAMSAVLNYCDRARRDALLDAYADRVGADPVPRRMLSPDEMREMESGGVRFGSHTLSHPILANIAPEERKIELSRSRERLSAALGRDVDLIAYPNGRSIPHNFDDAVMADCAAAGYRAAVTSRRGTVTPSADDFALPRMGVSQDGGIARFALQLERFRAKARRGA